MKEPLGDDSEAGRLTLGLPIRQASSAGSLLLRSGGYGSSTALRKPNQPPPRVTIPWDTKDRR